MDACGNCGRSRKQGTAFCTGCGRRFADGSGYPPGLPGPPGGYARPKPSRLTFNPIVIAVIVIVLAAASGAGITVLLAGHHMPAKNAGRNAGDSTRATVPPSQDGSAAAPSPPDSSPGPLSVSPGPPSAGQVTIAPDASQSQNASSVALFLGQYFTAINTHDYQSYISLLSPPVQEGLTQEQFDHGYGSTTDSAETLVSISTVADGDLDATVTFTSHQNPADSPNQESCTDWKISLFLEQDGDGYLIDEPPPGYHAASAACP